MNSTHEPCNLREWKVKQGRLLTCGRPGRGYYAAGTLPHGGVPNNILVEWIEGISVATVVHIVSLLGRKSNNTSEFKYYPFRSCEESNNKPTFQAWLNSKKPNLVVHEFPTVDYEDIPDDRVTAIRACIDRLLAGGQTVVLLDSAGAVRTKQVREAMGLTIQKDTLTNPCV